MTPVALALAALTCLGCPNPAAAACNRVSLDARSQTTLISATRVTSGTLTEPNRFRTVTRYTGLPAFCRVVGVIRPTRDSRVRFELWLPEAWNGRFLQVGNGGFGGAMVYDGLVLGLREGFAVASTDDGHESPTESQAVWAFGHPQKIVDFGYRAVHLTASISRAIIESHYGRPAAHAYFSGCSDGGREALMEVQRYPADFDGWVVGAPANNWTSLMIRFLRNVQLSALLDPPLSERQWRAVSTAILTGCNARDGVIEHPLQCHFDLAVLACAARPAPDCLTGQQLRVLRELYEGGAAHAASPVLTPSLQATMGTESSAAWQAAIVGDGRPGHENSGSASEQFATSFFRYVVYGDPGVAPRTLNVLRAALDSRAEVGAILDALDPDLTAVRTSGKKIIQYHGWSDPVVPAQYSLAYYRAVEQYLGGDIRDFYRLFMVPGMEHCEGGAGPNAFGQAVVAGASFDPEHHLLAALMAWVEEGSAPERIVATKFRDDVPGATASSTRALCAYPQNAKWDGRGDIRRASSFVCTSQ
jgi:Tannase and feruloyl esterase